MDYGILAWIAVHRASWLDGAMVALSAIGSGGTVWVMLSALTALLDRRRAMAAWQAVLAVLFAWCLSDGVVKPLVHRARPDVRLEASQLVTSSPSSPSFPSAHAATAAAGASMLGAAWPPARAAFWLLAIAITASRLYLGVHYPSDVLAGLLLGWAVAWFVRGQTTWWRSAGWSAV